MIIAHYMKDRQKKAWSPITDTLKLSTVGNQEASLKATSGNLPKGKLDSHSDNFMRI